MFETFKRDKTRQTGFKGKGKTGPRPAAIGIANNGTLSLNPAAYKLLPEGTKYVILMFDKETDQVAIRSMPSEGDNTYEVHLLSNGLQHRINARDFIRHYNIKTTNGKTYLVDTRYDMITFGVETEEYVGRR